MKCSICGGDIAPAADGQVYGNNARPVNGGRCCDDCNWAVVVPARIKAVRPWRRATEEKARASKAD